MQLSTCFKGSRSLSISTSLSLSLSLKIKQNEGKIKQRFDNQKNEARPKSEKGKNPAHTLAHTHAHRHTHTMIKFKAEIYLCSESTQRESEREGGRETERKLVSSAARSTASRAQE